jgi:acyl-CoA reductase-like NAD-dependent aldehyde dehydrogenase
VEGFTITIQFTQQQQQQPKQITERQEEFAMALCIEAGKPIKDAKGEVQRLIDTFTIAAEESVRIRGEWCAVRFAIATIVSYLTISY